MITLIYTSTATNEMTEQDLLDLLDEARVKNKQNHITGMLLYGRGCFFQVLEGEEAVLEDVYKKITRDKRNFGHFLLLKKQISERSFPDWTMGFKNLNFADAETIVGYNNFMNIEQHEVQNHPELVTNMLYQFAKNC